MSRVPPSTPPSLAKPASSLFKRRKVAKFAIDAARHGGLPMSRLSVMGANQPLATPKTYPQLPVSLANIKQEFPNGETETGTTSTLSGARLPISLANIKQEIPDGDTKIDKSSTSWSLDAQLPISLANIKQEIPDGETEIDTFGMSLDDYLPISIADIKQETPDVMKETSISSTSPRTPLPNGITTIKQEMPEWKKIVTPSILKLPQVHPRLPTSIAKIKQEDPGNRETKKPASITENPKPIPKKEPQIIRWRQLQPTARSGSVLPVARQGHKAIAIDDKYVVVIGGGNQGLCGDMHILDLSKIEWFQPKIVGEVPPPLAGFDLAYDTTKDPRILIFGGIEGFYKYSNDLYDLKYDKNDDAWIWRKLNPLQTLDPLQPLPAPRFAHTFTIIKDKVYLFGGIANVARYSPHYNDDEFVPQHLNDLFVLNIRKNYPHGGWDAPVTYGNPPRARDSHSAVAYTKTASHNKIIFFSGMCGTRLSDIFVLDVDTMFWSRTAIHMPYSPGGRSLHSASLVGPRMYVFGGWTPMLKPGQREGFNGSEFLPERCKCVNSVGCFNVETMAWECVKIDQRILPPPRAGHCAFTANDNIYIWSGRDGYDGDHGRQVCLNDMWQLDLGLKPPPQVGNVQASPGPGVVRLSWDRVPGADSYIVQCAPKIPTPTPTRESTRVPKTRRM